MGPLMLLYKLISMWLFQALPQPIEIVVIMHQLVGHVYHMGIVLALILNIFIINVILVRSQFKIHLLYSQYYNH